MNFLLDPVECGSKLEQTTEKGAKVFIMCEGILLPIQHKDSIRDEKQNWHVTSISFWKCSKCGREVR